VLVRPFGADWNSGSGASWITRTETVGEPSAPVGAYASAVSRRLVATALAISAVSDGDGSVTLISMITVFCGVVTVTARASSCGVTSRPRRVITGSSTAGDSASSPNDSIWLCV
jgi:hypothetical protein